MRNRTLRASGLEFSAIEAGKGPLVLCVHGFPDTRRTFVPLIEELARAGYRAVAPQLRGYEHSSHPEGGDFYMESLAVDVLGWIEDLGEERAHLVGHDWGAAMVYAAAAMAPESVQTVTAMSVPHLRHFRRRIWRHPSQLRRSWYMAFFQLRHLAERVVSSQRVDFIPRLIRSWSPGWDPPADWLDDVMAIFADPTLARNALSYYRCAFDWREGRGKRSLKLTSERTHAPTLSVVGSQDGCMGQGLFESMMDPGDFSGGLNRGTVQGAGHFVQMEQPEQVAQLILNFIKDH